MTSGRIQVNFLAFAIKYFLWATAAASVTCCKATHDPIATQYPPQVGHTYFDPEIDDPSFVICDTARIYQYYNFNKGLQYEGEKSAIVNHYRANLRVKNLVNETGYITIRFVVNCQGKTGWFRIQEMDQNYQPRKFRPEITAELLSLTRDLDRWIVADNGQSKVDYYQYLTFKIKDGLLVEIMP